jgi:hypothetical protein
MNTFYGPALPEWKIALLMSMTLVVIASAHWHSFREAWAEMQARNLPTRWRQVLSYVARHELHYAKQVPLMVLFVLSSVVVFAHL